MTLAVMCMFWMLLIVAALQDMRSLRIANSISLTIVALFLIWVAVTRFENDIWQNVAVCAATFVICTGLFAIHWLGGGDVKLLTATALWFDFTGAPALLASIALGGGLVTIVLIALRRLLPENSYERTGWKVLQRRGPIPYGLAIAIGAILCSISPGFNPHQAPPRSLAQP